MKGAGKSAHRRDFPGRVLLISLLRVLHVIGVVGSSAVLLGAKPLAGSDVYALVLVVSGASMMLLDSWANPDYFRQVSGLAIMLWLACWRPYSGRCWWVRCCSRMRHADCGIDSCCLARQDAGSARAATATDVIYCMN